MDYDADRLCYRSSTLPTVKRPPWMAVTLVLVCIIFYLLGAEEWGTYKRDLAEQNWRFVFASFSHYNLIHLVSNISVLFVLGSMLEIKSHTAWLLLLTLVVTSTTIVFLHLCLPAYVIFAGISCLNFALLGYFLGEECEHHLNLCVAITLLLVAYEVYVVMFIAESLSDSTKPVWQLHLIAFLEGVGLHLIQRRLIRTRLRGINT